MARGARLPGDPWTPRDWALQQAADLLDSTRCSGCGQPTWLAHDPASYWTPHEVKCESCAAIEDLKERLPEDVKHPSARHYYTTPAKKPERGKRGRS